MEQGGNGYERIYVVRTKMSSPNHIENTQEIDELNVQQTFKYAKKVRQEIGRVRGRHKTAIDERTLNFEGLPLCNDEAKEFIQERINLADEEYKEISPYLGANVTFIPLDMDAIHKGELYSRVLSAIWYRVYKDAIEQMSDVIEKRGDELPVRSKNALLKMCNRLRGMNIADDKNIDKLINEIQKSIEDEAIAPMVEYLDAELAAMTGKPKKASAGRWQKVRV